jgi:hypothetical protein
MHERTGRGAKLNDTPYKFHGLEVVFFAPIKGIESWHLKSHRCHARWCRSMCPSEPHTDVYQHVCGADDGRRHVDEKPEVGSGYVREDEKYCPGSVNLLTNGTEIRDLGRTAYVESAALSTMMATIDWRCKRTLVPGQGRKEGTRTRNERPPAGLTALWIFLSFQLMKPRQRKLQ